MLSMADTDASSTRYNVLPCQRLMHVEFIARQVHTRGIANLYIKKGMTRVCVKMWYTLW